MSPNWILSADPGSSSQWIAGGAALALLTVAITFNFRNQLASAREIRELKNDKRILEWRISKLVEAINLTCPTFRYPPDFWVIPDHIANPPEKKKRSRKLSITGEDGKIDKTFVSVFTLILISFTAFALILNLLIITPIHDLGQSGSQDRCVASLTADYFVAIDLGLAASPNSHDRDVYIRIANQAAERIRNRGSICDDGKPDKFDLPPVPGVNSP